MSPRSSCLLYFWCLNLQRCGRPYPYLGPNAFKLFADSQVFFVTLVSLVLRVSEEELAKDPFNGGEGWLTESIYGDILLLLLVTEDLGLHELILGLELVALRCERGFRH